MGQNKYNWDDIRLFLHLAEEGSLNATAQKHGSSPATIGRRVARLERELGVELFHHAQSGYRLTEAGTEFLEYAREFRTADRGLSDWRKRQEGVRQLHVSAGYWTCWRLAQSSEKLVRSDDVFRLHIASATARLDIGRRQADIGIRNQRPDHVWLAAKKLGEVNFAPYQSRVGKVVTGYIAIEEPNSAAPHTPSQRWLRETHADQVVLTVSSQSSALDFARAGVGIVLLPTFVGDTFNDLQRCGGLVDALTHDQYLAVHNERRYDPLIREVITRIEQILGT